MLYKFSRKEYSKIWDLDCMITFTVSNAIDCALSSTYRRTRCFIWASHIYLCHLTLTTNLQNNYSCTPHLVISSHTCILVHSNFKFFLFWSPLFYPLILNVAVIVALDRTQTHTALSNTTLDEGSAHRGKLFLTTHNIDKRQTSMVPAGFEPATQQSNGRIPTP